MKKALIITGKFVQDPEYIYPYYRLQEAGFTVDTAVKDKETVFGVIGVKVVPTRSFKIFAQAIMIFWCFPEVPGAWNM